MRSRAPRWSSVLQRLNAKFSQLPFWKRLVFAVVMTLLALASALQLRESAQTGLIEGGRRSHWSVTYASDPLPFVLAYALSVALFFLFVLGAVAYWRSVVAPARNSSVASPPSR